MPFDREFWEELLKEDNPARLPERSPAPPAPVSAPTPPKPPPPPTVRRSTRPSIRTRIEVNLVSKPRDYVPGSGPPLQPITLLPPRDSTAYIIERVFLPSKGLAASGKPLPKRMTYLIGWYDLPAATLLVPAMDILDYVSPMMLEEWELQLEEEVDEERRRLKEEADLGAVASRKRKRGRPPAHSAIESAAGAEPETAGQTKPRPKTGVMCLSTPQKTRLQDFEGLSDEEESPSRQIAQEACEHLQGIRDLTEGEMETESSLAPGSRASPSMGLIRGELPPIEDGTKELGKTMRPWWDPPAGWSWKPEEAHGRISAFEMQTNQHLKQLPKPNGSTKQQSILSAFASAAKTGEVSAWTHASADQTRGTAIKPSITDSLASKPKKPRKRLKQESQPQDADSWAVERIEDVKYYEVENKGEVRYFKVRWEGDWPPDQKTTWEPEDNIPAGLVRNFFKLPKSRRVAVAKEDEPEPNGSKQSDSKLKQKKLPWAAIGRQYSSVSEAFAGDILTDGDNDVDLIAHSADYQPEDGTNENGQDEFFVVQEEEDRRIGDTQPWYSNGSVSNALGLLSMHDERAGH